jgi:hypothetical protein
MWFRPLERNTLCPWRELLYYYVFFKLGFSWLEATWFESVAVHPFIAQGQTVTCSPRGLTGGPRVVTPCYIN